jgi:phospholipid/cholesterol/gamma-HCH transport system substrate-binding protein
MASAKKVRWAQLRVGLMAVASMVVLAVLISLLTANKKLFESKATLYTFMEDSAALGTGSPVRLNGILIGSVTQVGLSGESVPRRIVRITMRVGSSELTRIPVDSQAAISSENVLGTKFINIRRGKSTQTAKDQGEIPSLDVSGLEEVVQSGYDLTVVARTLLARIDRLVADVENGQGTIGKLLVDEKLYTGLTNTVEEARKVTSALSSGQGTVGKLLYDPSLYTELQGTMRKLDDIVTGIQNGQGTAGKLINDPALYDDARKTMAELRRLTEDLNAGKGTAGKLLKDEDLHVRIQSTITKLETTLDKINSGQGTLGQLMVNPSLYDSINGSTQELQSLLKDFRANPKKFLSIKLGLF